MVGIKIFECAICKKLFFNNVKGESRFIGTRGTIREHLRKIHHINSKAKFYGNLSGHKGNRVHFDKGNFGENVIKDERGILSRNCVLYRKY